MIKVRIGLDSLGVLRSFKADGHSDYAAHGNNIVCAAFTCIARSAAKVLEAEPGVDLAGDAPVAGIMQFVISDCIPGKRDWLEGVQDVLVRGIEDLRTEYPEQLQLDIGCFDEER